MPTIIRKDLVVILILLDAERELSKQFQFHFRIILSNVRLREK